MGHLHINFNEISLSGLGQKNTTILNEKYFFIYISNVQNFELCTYCYKRHNLISNIIHSDITMIPGSNKCGQTMTSSRLVINLSGWWLSYDLYFIVDGTW